MRRPIYPNGSGGGGGELTVYDTYAQLDATSPDDDDLGLVASGTAGEPRLFRYATDTWIPDEPVVWTIATTGAGVMTGLIDAAGEAVYPGDLGIDGNGTVYYAAGAAGRCFFMPRALTGGIIVGETHTASLVGGWYDSDPSGVDGIDVIASGGASVTYSAGTGKTTVQAGASDSAQVLVGAAAEVGAGVVYAGLIGATWSGARAAGGEGLVEARYGASSPYERIRLVPELSIAYQLNIGAAVQSIPGGDPAIEHDIAFSWDGTTQRAYLNDPAPAQDGAVPSIDATRTGTPATLSTTTALGVVVNSDASTPSLVCDGAYIIALTAIP